MTQNELTGMSVEQLREYARKNTGLQKTAIVFMRKADLISAILDQLSVEQQRPAAATPQPQIDLAAVIAEALQGKITAGLDENRVREILAEGLKSECMLRYRDCGKLTQQKED